MYQNSPNVHINCLLLDDYQERNTPFAIFDVLFTCSKAEILLLISGLLEHDINDTRGMFMRRH
ncbi:hypothetical protein WN48_08098 [Eufriesea mexicana]|uniref:Uncharacterized protein n=1 Tax=Eufriesea mexicana TaxID=516756 RepID=A0A310SB17_9HYME|nr:hypothetical protein WN48_08098 [Eufriesea mexicana]